MRTPNARPVKLTPVDEDRGRLAVDHPDNYRMDAIYDQNLFRQQIRRERSSAYWFAASIWGICGLVIGACMGAYMMYVASVSTMPTAINAVTQSMAVRDIQRDREERNRTAPDSSEESASP